VARRLQGNESLRLDDPTVAWIVESGSVAVFAVEEREGTLVGPRRYFFTRGPGKALFGLPRTDAESRLSIVAVALEESRLRPAAAGSLEDDDSSGEAAVRDWIDAWTNALVGLSPPDATDRTLDRFHRRLTCQLHESSMEARDRDRESLLKREQRDRDVSGQALRELTSVMRPDRDELPVGTELFVASCVVGRALGIEMRPPPAWEKSTRSVDPVELIARASHVRTRVVVLDGNWWREDCGPMLAFVGPEKRPVALLPKGTGAYRWFDPATRAFSTLDRKSAATIRPQAYAFYRPLPDDATGRLELLRFALRGRGRDLALILGSGAAAALLGMFTPQATALLVDHAIPDADLVLLAQVGLGLLAAALGAAVFRLSQGIAMIRVETGANLVTQSAVWDRLLNLQMSFFRRFPTGDLQSRVTAVSQIRSYLGGTTMRTLFGCVILLLNLGLLLYYSPALTLVALGVAAATCAVTLVSGTMILRRTRVILELKGRFFGLMVQLINGIAKLRVAAAEERAFARWARDYAQLLRLELSQRRIQDTVQLLNIAISTISAVVLFATAAALIGRAPGGAGLTTGVFLAFNVAYGTFIGAMTGLSNTVIDVMAIAILRERAMPILEARPEISARKTDPGPLEGRMELDHVSFRYRADGPVVLDGVDLLVEPRQLVAIVGRSGSGKSTLFRLLLGFEDPLSGGIFYDGQELSGLDIHAVRRQMGVVLQNGRINAGSIFDNVAVGARVTLEDAWEAARSSGFADDIKAMPMGLHTVVSEGGTNLSGGQRQRLLLARALIHRPRILLLDEATSALDNRTQNVVSRSLQRLEVTRVVIAHRLSTIRHADRIFVIDSGRVVQSGRFEELGRQDGLFSRLMARQLAGE